MLVKDWRRISVSLMTFSTLAVLSAGAGADGMRAARSGENEVTEAAVWYGGYDAVKGARYVYDGLLVALNGDIGKDGFAVQVYGARTDFDQNPGEGRAYQAHVMLGYLFNIGQIGAGNVFVGPDWQNVRLDPNDPTAKVNGTEFGARVSAALTTAEKSPLYANLMGTYSTAFNSYWSRLRVGARYDRITFGPEFIAVGNASFDAQRLGGFVTFKLPIIPQHSTELTLAIGHQFVRDSGNGPGTGGNGTAGTGGDAGTYGSIGLSVTF
jgi:hypothetical protein